jgi:hypothetical protein
MDGTLFYFSCPEVVSWHIDPARVEDVACHFPHWTLDFAILGHLKFLDAQLSRRAEHPFWIPKDTSRVNSCGFSVGII